jgi:hypothetical protein
VREAVGTVNNEVVGTPIKVLDGAINVVEEGIINDALGVSIALGVTPIVVVVGTSKPVVTLGTMATYSEGAGERTGLALTTFSEASLSKLLLIVVECIDSTAGVAAKVEDDKDVTVEVGGWFEVKLETAIEPITIKTTNANKEKIREAEKPWVFTPLKWSGSKVTLLTTSTGSSWPSIEL